MVLCGLHTHQLNTHAGDFRATCSTKLLTAIMTAPAERKSFWKSLREFTIVESPSLRDLSTFSAWRFFQSPCGVCSVTASWFRCFYEEMFSVKLMSKMTERHGV